jgi:long-chain acyl-CoA synthetase
MANFMDLSAATYGERLAITLDSPLQYRVHTGDTMTYRQTSTLSSHMAHAMVRLGVKRGDRVVVVTSNRVDLPILVGAIIKMGGVAVPLNFMLRGKEIAYVVKNCGARVLVTDAEVFKRNIRVKEAIPGIETWVMAGPAEEVEEGFLSLDELMEGTPGEFEPLSVRGDDLVGIFYTSGTTGFPKGAMMTSRGMLTGQRLAAMAMPLGPGDLGIHCLPLAHLFGYGVCIMGQITGMSAYFMRYFNPVKVLQAIEEHRATVFVGVPVMYKSFFDVGFEGYDLSSMRFWASSADAMPQEYIERVRRQGSAWHLGPFKTGPVFAEAYGMVELSAIATLKLYFPGLHWPPGCVGFPIYPVRARVVDESGGKLPAGEAGELLVTGPGVMKGYWNNPQETERVMDGKWLHTGDIACKDRWGRVYFVDRAKDVIKCGGYSVFSVEVEQEILNHPALRQAVVVGVPHAVKGEAPVAVVCLREGLAPGEGVTEDELLKWCWANIARYKCPRRIHIVPSEEIPYGVTLKVLKRELRRRYIKDMEREDAPGPG